MMTIVSGFTSNTQLRFLLELRRNQFFREMQYLLKTDRGGVVIGGVVLCFFCVGIFFLAQSVFGAGELTLGAISLLWTLHQNRKDRDFLTSFSIPQTTLFAVEYCFLSSPLALVLLAAKPLQNWVFTLILVGASLFISLVPHLGSQKRSNDVSFFRWLKNLVPRLLARFTLTRTSYEWQAGFRERSVLIFALFSLALLASHLEWLIIACGLLALLFLLDVYGQGETRFMLECLRTRFSAVRLLWYKILQGCVIASCLSAPFLVLWAVRHAKSVGDVGIAAGGLLLLVLGLIGVSVISKYAFWKAGLSQRVLVGVMVAWVGYLLWLPMLFPMPQVILYFLYRKAVRTLDAI